tara:strand:+ start:11536 stop:12225 length:690 start_codon:yes stop_codon:yes gene_type:complete
MNYEFHDPHNWGVLDTKLEKDELNLTWDIIKKYSPKSAVWSGNELVSIDTDDKQWELTDTDNKWENTILRPAVAKYAERWGMPCRSITTHFHGLSFNRFWCRASTVGDYQSLHHHESVLSFVVWMNIPFNSRIERNIQPGFRPSAGDFCLYYTDSIGQVQEMTWHISKECNGQMIVFPSAWKHAVWPHFSTEDYRISIAGDVAINSYDVYDPIHNLADPSKERDINENV